MTRYVTLSIEEVREIGYLVIIVVLVLNIYAIYSNLKDNNMAFAISKVLADGISLIYICTH